MNIVKLLGILGGIFSTIAYIPYIVSIFKKETRPQRATWLIWIFSDSLVLASYYSLGATDSVWLPIAYVIGTIVVFLLSIKYGEGGTAAADIFCLIMTGVSGALWWYTKNPMSALLTNLAIVIIGIIPTIPKVWKDPYSENLFAFSFWGSGSVCTLLAVVLSKNNGFAMYIAPTVFLVLQCIVAFFMIMRRIYIKKNK